MKLVATVSLFCALFATTGVVGADYAGAHRLAVVSAPNVGHSSSSPEHLPLDDGKDETDLALAVEVVGLRNNTGQVGVVLYDSAKGFPDKGKGLRNGISRKIKGKRVRVEFSGLRPGSYAVAILHDENANGEMDFNLIGIPKEGFGFSNDAEVVLGPPSFEDAAFKLILKRSKITITAKYLL